MNPNGFSAGENGAFEISGQVTFQTVPQFLAYTDQWLRDSTQAVTIDMHKVTLADSAGLALMLEWMQLARAANRELSFANIPEQMHDLIRVNGLEKVFQL
ncbi:MAG: STAS domain-containing protein [Gammaproteobacteria bacterium]|nr:STAS domain-containing protein [Gammaproteobacteria bacterium]